MKAYVDGIPALKKAQAVSEAAQVRSGNGLHLVRNEYLHGLWADRNIAQNGLFQAIYEFASKRPAWHKQLDPKLANALMDDCIDLVKLDTNAIQKPHPTAWLGGWEDIGCQ